MKAENMWTMISSMPDSRYKAVKVINFAYSQIPYGFWWDTAMEEFHRLHKLGYWKWTIKSKQNG